VKEALARFAAKYRLKPYHLALCVLFVGWAPSLLLAYYSYNVLSRTVEAKIMTDARSLARSLSQHVQNELERIGETMDYYRTLPATLNAFQPPVAPAAPASPSAPPANGTRRPPTTPPTTTTTIRPGLPPNGPATTLPGGPSAAAQQAATPTARDWLASVYYPQKRIDGMFLTDPTGHVTASLPLGSGVGATRTAFGANWQEAVTHADASYYFTPVYPRAADGRLVTSVIVAVRDKTGILLGFFGADILVERIGRRLQSIETASGMDSALKIIDQKDFSLFKPDMAPNPLGRTDIDAALLASFRERKNGVEETGDKLYIFSTIERAGWIVVLEKGSQMAHQPVRDLLRQTLLLAGWLVVGTAITAYLVSGFYRRQLQSSLRIEREQVFNEKILANMPVGIALIDPQTERFLQANSAFVEIARSLGALERGASITQLTLVKLPITTRDALARVLHFGVPFQAIEQRTPTANGQFRYLTTNLLRLQDSHQRTLGALCLVEDNTPAVTLRQELINANAAKDQFLAQLSHELRNPLSPVITMVAELEVIAETLPDARQPLEIIRRNVELEARLIDDLLDVTRISSGKLQLTREAVDLHRTVRLALEICQREINDKRLDISLDLRADAHWVRADPARLQQIFWNLITNAVKFTPQGCRITIRSFNPTHGAANADGSKTHINFVAMQASGAANSNGARQASDTTTTPNPGPRDPAGHFIRLDIIDEGIGIEPQHLARIFNAFEQGQSSITRRFGGLGLGLAISRAMVEAHGGSLTASSAGAGRGSTFSVELETCLQPPPSESGGANKLTPAIPSPMATEGCRVLLVDDHHDTCLGMKRLLSRRGYQVTTAHSVNEAILCAGRESFDLIISDLGLPDGTGFDLMAQLQQRGGPPGIALSGFGMESDIDRSREVGFSDHLIKPVDIEQLDAAMRKILGSRPIDSR
jgi:signal transduction histidine kinase/CheY-like chemotaxis protein